MFVSYVMGVTLDPVLPISSSTCNGTSSEGGPGKVTPQTRLLLKLVDTSAEDKDVYIDELCVQNGWARYSSDKLSADNDTLSGTGGSATSLCPTGGSATSLCGTGGSASSLCGNSIISTDSTPLSPPATANLTGPSKLVNHVPSRS